MDIIFYILFVVVFAGLYYLYNRKVDVPMGSTNVEIGNLSDVVLETSDQYEVKSARYVSIEYGTSCNIVTYTIVVDYKEKADEICSMVFTPFKKMGSDASIVAENGVSSDSSSIYMNTSYRDDGKVQVYFWPNGTGEQNVTVTLLWK